MLKDIAATLDKPALYGDPDTRVTGVTHDSRKVKQGTLFVALVGETADGHDFIGRAMEAGAGAIMAMTEPGDEFAGVSWIRVADTRLALGQAAALVYGHPTTKLNLVGITGTNGKTTLTFLLEAILKAAGFCTGVVGTISHRWAGTDHAAVNTTPEASDLQHMFAIMVQDGVTHALMEVSSHGLHRGRLEGCDFDIAVFTNLTQDHLDYHGNLEEYYLAKKSLFSRLLPASRKTHPTAVVNLDDPYGERLKFEINSVSWTSFGTEPCCDIHPLDSTLARDGMSATIQTGRGPISITSGLTGSFNLSNIMAAIAVAERLDIAVEAVRTGIEMVRTVPGRLERVASDQGSIFVDYAHTPNALKNVLDALRLIRKARIITVMGCGGDRDKTKRPIMGKEAAVGSDFVVVTSDNPRTEDPLAIIRHVEEGVRDYGFLPYGEESNGTPLKAGCYRVLPDRRDAIAWAVRHLGSEDILLIAGKGHETYQEINGIRHPFDDREVVLEEIAKYKGTVESGSGNTFVSGASESGSTCS
jgi:UDP-N-acetylmuramoyl-L-alanyl-D-glutamate--2,6-diaminopimelate ligase